MKAVAYTEAAILALLTVCLAGITFHLLANGRLALGAVFVLMTAGAAGLTACTFKEARKEKES